MEKMKNFKVKHAICVVLSLPLLFLGCQRQDETTSDQKNRLVPLNSDAKTGSTYLMLGLVGHDGSKCPGCVLESGQLIHVDCQGDGHQCTVSSAVTLVNIAGGLIAVTTDTFGLTNLNYFNMPARSLSTGEGGSTAYLNIPAQLVERDTATLQFTFTGLFYTGKPAYNNF